SARGAGGGGCRPDDGREGGTALCRGPGAAELAVGASGIETDILDIAVGDAAVVETIPTTNYGVAVTEKVIGEADAGPEVCVVAGSVRHAVVGYEAACRGGEIRIGAGDGFFVPAQAKLDSKPRRELPVVLCEDAGIQGGHGIDRVTKTLGERAVAWVHTGDGAAVLRSAGIASFARGRRADAIHLVENVVIEVADVLIRVGPITLEGVVHQIVVVNSIDAEAQAMTALVPVDDVADLPLTLVGIGNAP